MTPALSRVTIDWLLVRWLIELPTGVVHVSRRSTLVGRSSTVTCCWSVTTVVCTTHTVPRWHKTVMSCSSFTWTRRQRSPRPYHRYDTSSLRGGHSPGKSEKPAVREFKSG